jgi:hypothetical protein
MSLQVSKSTERRRVNCLVNCGVWEVTMCRHRFIATMYQCGEQCGLWGSLCQEEPGVDRKLCAFCFAVDLWLL